MVVVVLSILRSDAKFDVNFNVNVLFWKTEVRRGKALLEKLRDQQYRTSALMLERNTLLSIASFTPIIDISVKTNTNTIGVNTS